MTLHWRNWPKGKYDLIVVDPPWQIGKVNKSNRALRKDGTRSAHNQRKVYQQLSLTQIQLLPIQRLAKDNCVVFLWTIQKHLRQAFSVMDTWGFSHRLTLTWHKNIGLALFGFRWESEFVLVGYCGKMDVFPKRPTVRTCFQAPNRGHSVKPDEFYEMIKPFGKKRIDLFARQPRDGYDVWGNEV